MKQLINQTNLKMSSREIAQLCEKEHRHVLRDIEVMFNQLDIDPEGYAQTWTHPQNGQNYKEYQLNKEFTLTLVAGYNIKLRHRIIKRWQELENQINQPKLPQNYLEALEHLLESEKEKLLLQEQKEALEDKLEEAQPKINYADRHQLADGSLNIRDTAKLINIPERQFIQLLLEKEFVYRNTTDARLIPYSDTIKRGLMDCRAITYQSRDGTEKLKSQAVITPKGLQYFQHHFSNVFA